MTTMTTAEREFCRSRINGSALILLGLLRIGVTLSLWGESMNILCNSLHNGELQIVMEKLITSKE
ncbi:hypothetical protein CYOC110262_05285 [Cytobacillus oceanisediminis]|uniref:Uncharacterized protein n=1 Tax=Cytobacillus oceanisediminis TaxID=665099 RepID=A0A562K403_9BACI|nr:hypothetical protein IQ19_01222 [Cytobacillus oceanisediminis]